MRLVFLIMPLLASCTTTHSVYVSNGDSGRAGHKASLDANAEVTSKVIGVQTEIQGDQDGK